MNKKSKITIENNGVSIDFTINHQGKEDGQKVRRALVLRFMDYYDTMRQVRASGFKASEPFQITMSTGSRVLFNTATLSMDARAKLKLQNTPQGRVRFMTRLDILVAFMQRCEGASVDNTIDTLESLLLEA
jgi:hypothetical protein